MADKQFLWKRPLLVGGLGLSASLWLLEATHLSGFDGSTWFSALALGSGLWWWRQRRPKAISAPRPVAAPVVDRARVEAQLTDLRRLIEILKLETLTVKPSNLKTPTVGLPTVEPPTLEALKIESATLEPLPSNLNGPSPLPNPAHRRDEVASSALGTAPQTIISDYEAQCRALAIALDRTQLQGLVVGERRSGKSILLQHLGTLKTASAPSANQDKANLGQPGVTWTETLPACADSVEADLVLWVTDGDLTASALAQLRQHVIAGQGVILAFNKTDHYTPTDRHTVLTQLQRQGDSLPGPVAVVAVAADPRPITVRRHQEDGQVEESQETVPPQLADLDAVLAEVLTQAPTLVAATTLRQGEALRQRIQQDLNQVRRQRAMPLIDQLQWVAAAAAFANPVPTLDVLATLAINGQLMMDLGKIYGFNLSLDEAKTAATTLAELTVKLGLVELSTQVLTAVLKSHFATYLAGGTVQGLSAAYLTRMAGLSVIDYFEQAALAGTPTQALSWEAIAQRLPTVMQQNRQITLLQNLVKQGISILKPSPSPALITASTQAPLTLTRPDPITVAAPSAPLTVPDSPPPHP